MPAATSSVPAAASSAASSPKKYNTVTGFSQYTNRSKQQSAAESSGQGIASRSTVKGLFEGSNRASRNGAIDQEDASNSLQTSHDRGDFLGSMTNRGMMGREDGPWSVSVAEAPPPSSTSGEKRESRKKARVGLHMYTLYITTPTHNLTLLRSNAELIELDSKIREGQSAATTLPILPSLPVSTQQTSRKILQTLTRTLSPSVGRRGSALNTLTAPGLGLSEQVSPTSSRKIGPATPPAPQSPTPQESKRPTSAHTTTINLATYLTTLSNLPIVRKHKAWRRFIRVGSEDLESIRIERRIRKVRSDLAQHVKSSVAPTNTNVGTTPSQSDIGEEGTRTDDDRSISGQSTSNSYRRPDPPSRTASIDPDRLQREDRESSKKSGNFAGIPEELEREKQALDQEMSLDDSRDETNTSGIVKRERKHRRHVQREAEKVTVDDFDMIRVLGKGCAGKVLLVRHLSTKGLFAMKSIHKRHVLAHQELQHTLTEQAVLKRMAKEVMDPFVVKLWWSFHDKSNLYLVMDFHPGGDLATQLSRWGRLGRDRARFYAAEIVEGVEGLHRAGVIYRDLKPENVLIGADGHIVLSDFGLSKEFPVRGEGGGGTSTPPPTSPTRSHSSKDIKNPSSTWLSASEDNRSSIGAGSVTNSLGMDNLNGKGSRTRWADERDVTTTFCGTAEYLAPEVIQGSAYSYEVDWWSFGTMLYEMLTGITPFWADTHADMYVRVLHDELVFPDDRVLDQDTKSILRGLLQRNPMLRMKEPRIKRHPYFSMIEWAHVFHKRYIPPYIPPINPLDETDTQNFDEAFLDMQPVVNGAEDGLPEDEAAPDADMTAVSDNKVNAMSKAKGVMDHEKTNVKGSSDNKSLFDGYSFRGRKDSGSVKSSIFSTSAPSDHISATDGPTTTLTPSTSATEAIAPLSPSSVPQVVLPLESRTAVTEDDSEDDESAARAAVAALDQLEREAADEDEMMSNPSAQNLASSGTMGNVRKVEEEVTSSSTQIRVRLAGIASGGLSTHHPIAETDDDGEDDWDMVDIPSAGEAVHSEINGGKGQNLFARGVVDTYRLLRRQESSRIPSSPSYGSMNRSFNRLSRKGRPSKRNLRPTPTDQSANGSAISLARSSANEGGSRVSEEESQEMQRESRMGGPSPLPSSSAMMTPDEVAKAGSPSMASSEDIASQERNKQRLKKIKRFTSFFESNR